MILSYAITNKTNGYIGLINLGNLRYLTQIWAESTTAGVSWGLQFQAGVQSILTVNPYIKSTNSTIEFFNRIVNQNTWNGVSHWKFKNRIYLPATIRYGISGSALTAGQFVYFHLEVFED